MGNGPDRWIIVIVVLFLGLVAFTATLASCILADHGKEVPSFLQILGTAAITALAGVLPGINKTGQQPPDKPGLILPPGK